MLSLPPQTRIFISGTPCDMRKQHSGLAALVRRGTGNDPRAGMLYVFWNQRRDLVKVLFRDAHGYCLLAKRLDRDTFKIRVSGPPSDRPIEISTSDLASLLQNLAISTPNA